MSSWAEDNPIGISLIAVCCVMVVVALLLGVVWRQPPLATVDGEAVSDAPLQLDLPQLEGSEPLEQYTVITERPVFSPDRQPRLVEETEDREANNEEVDEEVDEPEMVLSGVVITPSIRMVTLQPKGAGESLVAFEGQPLEGDYGSWQVSHIEPRKATLSSANGHTMLLELQVHDTAIAAPKKTEKPKAEKSSGEKDGAAADDGGEKQLTRAEEIRQRIAERREELRQAADDKAQQEEGEAKPANYQSAIQSMIRGGKAQNREEDDKQ